MTCNTGGMQVSDGSDIYERVKRTVCSKVKEAEATQAATQARATKGISRARSKGKKRVTTHDPDDSP